MLSAWLSRSRGIACVAAAALCGAAVPAGAVPPGFQKILVFKGLAEPTAFDFLPDGRPIVAERWGHVAIITGNTKSIVLDLPDCAHEEEWGLLGLALDPNYLSNGFLYLYYTTESDGHRCRVSRFTVVEDHADLASEVIIWQNPQDCPGLSHHGGCIRFGPDGKLYIATGEEQLPEWAQDLTSQRGKILRMNSDGSVPADNPYVANASVNPYVWAYGLRNPFRFCFDSFSHRMYIGDVGFSSWEELDLGAPTANYGWPDMEGPQCYVADCSKYDFPEWYYSHGDPDTGACIILGPVYRGTQFPLEYRGKIFTADHVKGWIKTLELDANGHVVGDGVMFDEAEDIQTVTDLKVGPDGSLYYININIGEPEGQIMWKIAYAAGNTPPVPAIHAKPVNAPWPDLTVNFSAAGSWDNDPDGPPGDLTFTWDFGDGAAASGPIVSHTYTVWGRMYATVTVSDGELSATSKPVAITVGTPPTAVIDEPLEGTTYRAGDVIDFSGHGSSPDGPIGPDNLSWTVVIHHLTHVHPFLGPVTGSGGQFVIPDTGHSPENIDFRISLTVTDVDLITTTVTRTISPVVSLLSMRSDPEGIPVFIDDAPIQTPYDFKSVVNFHHQITARISTTLGGQPYRFIGWSLGVGNDFPYTSPEGGQTMTAFYEPGCAADINRDGFVNGDDFDLFTLLFDQGDPGADINVDDFVTGDDFDLFTAAFDAGC